MLPPEGSDVGEEIIGNGDACRIAPNSANVVLGAIQLPLI